MDVNRQPQPNDTMKTSQFRNTEFTQPERAADGTWSFQEFPAIGGDVMHSDFASRAEARIVRRMLVNLAATSGVESDLAFAR